MRKISPPFSTQLIAYNLKAEIPTIPASDSIVLDFPFDHNAMYFLKAVVWRVNNTDLGMVNMRIICMSDMSFSNGVQNVLFQFNGEDDGGVQLRASGLMVGNIQASRRYSRSDHMQDVSESLKEFPFTRDGNMRISIFNDKAVPVNNEDLTFLFLKESN